MFPQTHAQDVDGIQLQYLDYPGSGAPIVMLHATGFQPWLWHPIARELSRDYRVIAPYFCDHRSPDAGKLTLSWQVLADDLAAFIERLGLEKPFFVGHSMGGTIATIVEALRGPIASRMVLIEPIFLPSSLYGVEITVQQHPLASRAIRRRNKWKNQAEARGYFAGKKLFADWDPEMLDLYLEHGLLSTDSGELTLACQPQREAALFMGAMSLDPWKSLAKVSCPVLFVEGENSENRDVIDLKLAASMMPHASLKTVPGAGHLLPMEKPRDTLNLIIDFFRV